MSANYALERTFAARKSLNATLAHGLVALVENMISESELDSSAVRRMLGVESDNTDFRVFRCSGCSSFYLLDAEVDKVYALSSEGLRLVGSIYSMTDSIACAGCNATLAATDIWDGVNDRSCLSTNLEELAQSDCSWIVRTVG